MAYFNNDDSYYSTFPTPEEFSSYPFLQNQGFTSTGQTYDQEVSAFDGGWTPTDQSGFVAGPSNIPLATTNYGENLATYFVGLWLTYGPLGSPSYVAGPYSASSHGSYDWPKINQPAPLYNPGTSNFGSFYPNERGWGTGMPVLPIDPGKCHSELLESETRVLTGCIQSRPTPGGHTNMGYQLARPAW